ncbi:hypothetical protein LGT39_00435 [Demequina sp. TTPB684]|uniref:hypothetical protein n=1 Tax=unclassified Demequina TaxID=2620311 RepID=UPI001CF31E6A|nr:MULTISPECIES: hypothetical protein [unclassified Demequina]MCB2411310.1 hypothetical protein [Demequina sp. TTPB684]UPU88578.1 hypothetical protein LGT36_001240 [Demequina sp. TMPB413]
MTQVDRDAALMRVADAKLSAMGLARDSYFVGSPRDERPGLLLRDGVWTAGYFERGGFSASFADRDMERMLERFVRWVEAEQAFTRAAVQMSERQDERRSQDGP